MENEVIISTKAASQLRKIDQRYMNAIKTKIAMLKNFPDVYLDMKHLGSNQYRMRHGDYWIFFEVSNRRCAESHQHHAGETAHHNDL